MKAVLTTFILMFASIFAIGAEKIYWTDFYSSTVKQENLIHTGEVRGYAIAKSQQLVYNSSDWQINYTIKLDSKSKVWGIVNKGKGASLADMELGFHLSNFNDKRLTLFFYGRSIKAFSLLGVSEIKLENVNGLCKVFLDQKLVYSTSLNVNNIYNVMGMVEEFSSLGRLTFSSSHRDIFVVAYDTLTSKGDIQVNLPTNTPAGPYHYLISNEGYVDFNQVYRTLLDSTDVSFANTFLNTKTASTNYTYKDLEVGGYYISVLDDKLQVLLREKVFINPEIEPLSNSGLIKEGKLLIAEQDSAYADLPVLLTSEKLSEINYGVKIFSAATEQYFGLGIDSVTMSSSEDILFGFIVKDGHIFIKDNGKPIDVKTSVKDSDSLIIKYSLETFHFLLNDKIIYQTKITDELKERMRKTGLNLNFKIAILKAGVFLKPLVISIGGSLSSTLDIEVQPIKCAEEHGSVEFDFSWNNSYFFQFDYVEYEVKDENNNAVGGVNPTTLQNLPPGIYWVTGNVYFTSNHPLFSNPQPKVIDEYFVIGYPVEWINKLDTEYDAADESLTRVGNTLVNNTGHAATKNNILGNGVSWVDFKLKVDTNIHSHFDFFEWSSPPLIQTTNNPFLFYTYGSSLWIITQNYSNVVSSYSPEKDRFRVACDGNLITISRNGNLITSFQALPGDFKRLNVFLNRLNDAIYDVYTNMTCFVPEQPYAHLKYELDGFYHTIKNGKIKFIFHNDYNESELMFKIYSKTDKEIRDQTDFDPINVEYGDNYVTIDFSNEEDCLSRGMHYLEVVNEKSERFYLRFYNDFKGLCEEGQTPIGINN